jgi:hypothetical protein
MVNKPKQKGTAAETAVVRYLRANGFPQADRAAPHGNLDIGDIIGVKYTTIEVKNCKQLQVGKWLKELDTEFENMSAHTHRGVFLAGLWVKKYGSTDPGDWPVYIPWPFADRLAIFHNWMALPDSAVVTIPGVGFVQAIHAFIERIENR